MVVESPENIPESFESKPEFGEILKTFERSAKGMEFNARRSEDVDRKYKDRIGADIENLGHKYMIEDPKYASQRNASNEIMSLRTSVRSDLENITSHLDLNLSTEMFNKLSGYIYQLEADSGDSEAILANLKYTITATKTYRDGYIRDRYDKLNIRGRIGSKIDNTQEKFPAYYREASNEEIAQRISDQRILGSVKRLGYGLRDMNDGLRQINGWAKNFDQSAIEDFDKHYLEFSTTLTSLIKWVESTKLTKD